MYSTSSKKPMSSMRSASSKTTTCMEANFKTLRFMRSIIRPGVPTTMCMLPFRACICLFIDSPPYTGRTRIFWYLPNFAMLSATCTANSLVGVKIKPCTPLMLGFKR